MTETNDNKPIASKQCDRVHAAIWRQVGEGDQAGEPYFQLTLSRNYKDRNGAWQRSHHFSVRDLPHLALAVEWALRELLMKPE